MNKIIVIVFTIVLTICSTFAADWRETSTELIKSFEKFSETPYRDVNRQAIGWGFNDPQLVKKGYISREEADRILNGYVSSCNGTIDTYVEVPLTDNQRAALIVFIYNVGSGNFASSTLLKKLNRREYTAVASEIKRWNKVKKTDANGRIVRDRNGKIIYEVSPGLVRRREAEANLWLKP